MYSTSLHTGQQYGTNHEGETQRSEPMRIQQQQQQQHQSVHVSTPSFQHQPQSSIPATQQSGILLFLLY